MLRWGLAVALLPLVATAGVPETGRIDQLRDAVLAQRSASARAVPADTGTPPSTVDLAPRIATLRADPLFAAYGLQLEGRVQRDFARKLLEQGQAQEALRSAQAADAAFVGAAAACPPPSVRSKSAEELGLTRAVVAEAHLALAHPADARAAYEDAFAQLQRAGLLSRVRPATVERYARACGESAAPSCAQWLAALRPGAQAPSRDAGAAGAEPTAGATGPVADAGTATAPVDAGVPLAARPPPAPRARPADEARFLEGFGLLRAGKAVEAAAMLQALPADFPDTEHAHRARYWAGVALRRAGQRAQARALLTRVVEDAPLTYYGWRAAAELGVDLRAQLAARPPRATRRDPALDACEARRVERAEAFLGEGLRAPAADELLGLASGPEERLSAPFVLYLATLQSEAGDDPSAFQTVSLLLRRKAPEGRSRFAVRLLFPPRHLEAVRRAAREARVEPALVLSVMKQESSFRTGAESTQGAVGLMQLLPATAERLLPGARGHLTEPETNVRAGARYLAQLLGCYRQNVPLALAAYNAGPRRLGEWQAQGLAFDDADVFVETLPATETRGYVSQILRSYHWYAGDVLGGRPRPLSRLWVAGTRDASQVSGCHRAAAPGARKR